MTVPGEKLSAYIDNELSETEARQIEKLLENDPVARAELEALMEADSAAKAEFDRMLGDPVRLTVAANLKRKTLAHAKAEPARRGLSVWTAIAASVAFLALGCVVGYLTGTQRQAETAQASGWLDDVADYHAVYSTQTRHLVEVSAAESDHLRTWLTKSVGAVFSIPDLSDFGLAFQGGRLLVAAGEPVAQLIYTDNTGTVVALCFTTSDTTADAFIQQTIRGFDMVSWKSDNANFVLVAPEGYNKLDAIAASAAVAL